MFDIRWSCLCVGFRSCPGRLVDEEVLCLEIEQSLHVVRTRRGKLNCS